MSSGLTRGLVAEPAVIDDGLTQTTTTWSSTKIAAEISGGGGGTGDVTGPSSSTANAVARFNGTTGKLLANSGLLAAANSGSPVAPALSFSPSPNTGLFLASVALGTLPAVGIAANGAPVMTVGPDRIVASQRIQEIAGTSSAPAYTFATDTQAGTFYDGSSQGVGLSAGGDTVLLASPADGGKVLAAPIVSLTDGAAEFPRGVSIPTQGGYDTASPLDIAFETPLHPEVQPCGFATSDFGSLKYFQGGIGVFDASIYSTNTEERGITAPVLFGDRVQLKADRVDNSAFAVDFGDVIYSGQGRWNGVSFVAPGDPLTTGEVRLYAVSEERVAALPLTTKISGPGATPPAITIDADSIDVNAPITTGLIGQPVLSGAGDPTGGYAFTSAGEPVFLMGGTDAMRMNSTRMTLFNRGVRTTGSGTGYEISAIGQGMFDGSSAGGLDFYVLNDSSASTFAGGFAYNTTIARPVMYATALATDGNLGMQGNLDNSITDPDGKLALAFGPYDGGCNGLDVPNDAPSSAALKIGMVINSQRIWRTTATGFQIEAGKTFSLDGGATTITGPFRGKTTWIPVVGDGTTNFTIASSGGWYQVISGAVMFQTLFTISNKNGLGAQAIRMSLPTGTTSGTSYGQFGAFSALVMPTATTQLVARFSNGLNYASPIAREFSGGVMTETVCTANNFQTGISYTYSGTYFI